MVKGRQLQDFMAVFKDQKPCGLWPTGRNDKERPLWFKKNLLHSDLNDNGESINGQRKQGTSKLDGRLQEKETDLRRKKPNYAKLPPGPVPSPIVSNLLELGNKPHKSLAKLAATYGPIVALKLGHVTTIVISNATAAREVLQKHDLIFADRSIPHGVTANKHDQFSVAWLPVNAHWKTLRKICNYHIFTSQRLDAKQDLRRLKVQKLLTHVQESCQAGVAVEIGKAAFNTSLNLLSNTIFSVDLADPESGLAREFQKLVCSIMENIGRPNLADYFPLLRKIDPQGVKRRLTRDGGKITKLLQGLIDDRLLSRKAKDSQRKNDLLDALLDLIEEKFEGFDWNDIEHLLL
ncbi:Cytochrome P450, partial [Dillenia turbinata]